MRKLILLIIIIVATFSYGFCQIDTIPNASFERWKFMGWFENPEGWQTNNSQLMEYVVKDTDAYSGNLAMRINTNGWAQVQAPIIHSSGKQLIELYFYAKSKINNIDTFIIEVFLLNKGIVIDTGLTMITTNVDQYIFKNIPLGQYSDDADSIKIKIIGGTTSGNYIILDNFILQNVYDNINTYKFSNQSWKILNHNHTLEFAPIKTSKESVISIISVTGQTVYSKINCTLPLFIPLNPGIYFYRISQNNSLIQSGKVVVN